MQETKAFWKSRGFLGPCVAVVAMMLDGAGLGTIDQGQLVDWLLNGFEIGGAILGIVGRARATARLGLRDLPPPTADRPDRAAGFQAAWPATLAAIGLALFAVGCTPRITAVVGQGIEAARQAKDTEAKVLKNSVCAISIGAYHRVNNDEEKRALDVLCGGEYERPITADDVRAIRDLGALLGGS